MNRRYRLAFASLLLLVAGCGADQRLVGKWTASPSAAMVAAVDDNPSTNENALANELAKSMISKLVMDFEFRKDGTYTSELGVKKMSGTYSLSGDRLTLDGDGGKNTNRLAFDGTEKFQLFDNNGKENLVFTRRTD